MKLRHLATQQQVNALEADNHIISAASGAKTNSPAKRAEAIFVKSIIIVLLQTKPAEFSVTNILLTHFGIALIAISLSGRVPLRFSCFNYLRIIFTFGNLGDVRITIGRGLDRDAHSFRRIPALS